MFLATTYSPFKHKVHITATLQRLLKIKPLGTALTSLHLESDKCIPTQSGQCTQAATRCCLWHCLVWDTEKSIDMRTRTDTHTHQKSFRKSITSCVRSLRKRCVEGKHAWMGNVVISSGLNVTLWLPWWVTSDKKGSDCRCCRPAHPLAKRWYCSGHYNKGNSQFLVKFLIFN